MGPSCRSRRPFVAWRPTTCPSWASPGRRLPCPIRHGWSPPLARRSRSENMSRQFLLPDLGEGLTEAEIVAVLVHEGDVIREDAPLLEVETDKAQVEIPSPMSGRVEKIHVQPGQTVKVGATLISFADQGDVSRPSVAPTGPAAPAPPRASASEPKPAVARDAGPIPATPATRRLARELGVDLHGIPGTGRGGRVTDDDVRAARDSSKASPSHRPAAAQPAAEAKPLPLGIEEPPLPRFEHWGPVERQPLSHLRRTIAQRMTLS